MSVDRSCLKAKVERKSASARVHRPTSTSNKTPPLDIITNHIFLITVRRILSRLFKSFGALPQRLAEIAILNREVDAGFLDVVRQRGGGVCRCDEEGEIFGRVFENAIENNKVERDPENPNGSIN